MADTDYARGFKMARKLAAEIVRDHLSAEVQRGEDAIGMAKGSSYLLQDELEETLAAIESLGVDKDG